MPELPEVETVVRTLEQKIHNRIIESVDVIYERIVDDPDATAFSACLKGQKFEAFDRRGKFLVFNLTDYVMIAHLRMEGKFYVYPEHREPDKHTHIVFKLDKGELHYNDVRKFGRFWLYEKGQPLKALESLGYEPFDEKLNSEWFKSYCQHKNTPIKTQLLDQSMIAGIGNIYANEICFDVRINPMHPACFVSREKWDQIIESTRKILAEAIKAGGTTIRSYTSSLGVTGMFQQNLHVHSRAHEKCECGTEIEKCFVNGRGTYYCPNCQKEKALFAAVTGNIGSGKSTVSELIKEQGYPVISCDEINSQLWLDNEIRAEIRRITGEDEKKEVSRVIYSDPEIKEKLEEYLHGLIWQRVREFYEEHIDDPAVFVEVPLLFETDWYRRFDCNILVTCSVETAVERLQRTRNMSRENIMAVLNNQNPDSEKRAVADRVIDNDSTLDKLSIAVEKMLGDIVKFRQEKADK